MAADPHAATAGPTAARARVLPITRWGGVFLVVLAVANGAYLYLAPAEAETAYAWSIVPPSGQSAPPRSRARNVQRVRGVGRAVMLAAATGVAGGALFVTPASAAQIGIKEADNGPASLEGTRAVHMVAAPGELNDVVVQAEGGDLLGAGWPLTVTVTDPGATFDPAPPSGEQACVVVDPHTARCVAPSDAFFTQAVVELGDGDNRLRFGPGSEPLREQFSAGAGNDVIATGPFVGDASYRWSSSTGGGNDTVHIATPVSKALGVAPVGLPAEGLAVETGAGDDKVVAVNGAFDQVNCGSGADVLIADPEDSESIYVEPGGSCETRVLPPQLP
jgi:hypothetical protein